jgi:hypothetical protein
MNEFCGIDVRGEGRVVQEWFDALSLDAQLEILNMALHLESLPMGRWQRPDYDPLDGEGGISEVRPKDVRGETGNITYRIYGWRGYPNKNSYTFLHGTDKDVKNDLEGKAEAKRRVGQLVRDEARIHKFDFTPKTVSDSQEG